MSIDIFPQKTCSFMHSHKTIISRASFIKQKEALHAARSKINEDSQTSISLQSLGLGFTNKSPLLSILLSWSSSFSIPLSLHHFQKDLSTKSCLSAVLEYTRMYSSSNLFGSTSLMKFRGIFTTWPHFVKKVTCMKQDKIHAFYFIRKLVGGLGVKLS